MLENSWVFHCNVACTLCGHGARSYWVLWSARFVKQRTFTWVNQPPENITTSASPCEVFYLPHLKVKFFMYIIPFELSPEF